MSRAWSGSERIDAVKGLSFFGVVFVENVNTTASDQTNAQQELLLDLIARTNEQRA